LSKEAAPRTVGVEGQAVQHPRAPAVDRVARKAGEGLGEDDAGGVSGHVGPARRDAIHTGSVPKGSTCRASLDLQLDDAAPQGIGGVHPHQEAVRIVGEPPGLHRHVAAVAAKLAGQDLPSIAIGVQVGLAAGTAVGGRADQEVGGTIPVHVSGGADGAPEAVAGDLAVGNKVGGRVRPSRAAEVDVDPAHPVVRRIVGGADDHVGVPIAVHVPGRARSTPKVVDAVLAGGDENGGGVQPGGPAEVDWAGGLD
jgi:hypothetical protein